MDLGDLRVKLNLDTSGFSRGMSQATGAIRGIDRQFSAVAQSGSRVSGALQQVASTAAGFAIAEVGMRAVGAAMGFMRDAAVGLNDRLQQANIGFTTMLGSSELAGAYLKQLGQFAATTPFAFPELQSAAQRLMAMGFAAEETLPILRSVGNVAAALGTGTEGINRMTTALGQMAAKGKVQTEELLQMTEMGVPALKLLADQMGVTTAEAQDMVTKGQVASDVFIKAFDEWSKASFGDMMAQQSHTFSGAMSTVTDTAQMAVAQAFRPFFNAATRAVDALAQFMQTESFQRGVATVEALAQRAVDALGGIVRAVDEQGFAAAVGGVLARMEAFGRDMATAGWNVIVAYAGGMAQAANTVLQSVIEGIAQGIAAFLVGHSPPPEGPLSEVDAGGRATMEAWVAGAAEGAQGIEQVVADAAATIDELSAAGADAETALSRIDDELGAIDRASADVQRRADDLRDAYDDQIGALEAQVEAIRDTVSLQDKQRDLALALQDIEAARARIAAMGDPARRAELESQLAVIEAEQKRRQIAEDIADVERQIAEAPLEAQQDALALQEKRRRLAQQEAELQADIAAAPLADREAALKLQQQLAKLAAEEQDIRADQTAGKLTAAEAQAKLDGIAAEREQLALRQQQAALGVDDLQARAAQLEIDKQQLALEEQRAALDTGPDLAALQLRLDELRTEQALLDLTDDRALAEADRQQAVIDAQQEINRLTEDEEAARADILALPLEEQIAGLRAEQAAVLEPLQAQLDALARQRDLVEEQRKSWQGVKQDVDAAVAAMKAAEAPGGAGGAGGAGGGAAEKEKKALGPSVTLGPGEQRIAPEPLIPAGEQPTIEPYDINIDGEAIGRRIGEALTGGLGAYLRDNVGGIIGGGIGAAVGGAVLGPPGALIGGLLGRFIGEGVQTKLAEMGIGLDDVKAKFQSVGDTLQSVGKTIAETLQPPLQWIIDHGPQLLTVVEGIGVGLATWKVASTVATGIGALGTALSGISALGGMSGIMATIVAAINPVTLIIAGLAATVGLLVIAWQNDWGGIQEKTQEVFEAIKGFWDSTLKPVFDAISGFVGPLFDEYSARFGEFKELMGKEFTETWVAIKETVQPAIETITTVVGFLGEKIGAVFGWIGTFLSEHSETIKRVLGEAWGIIKTIIDDTLAIISNIIQGFLNLIQGDWGAAWENVKNVFWAAIDLVKTYATDLVTFIPKKLWELFTWLGGEAKDAITTKLGEWASAFLSWVTDGVLPFLGEKLAGIKDAITGFIGGAVADVKAKLGEWVTAFLDWVGDVTGVDGLPAKLGGILSTITGWVTDTVDDVKTSAKDLGGAIVNGIWEGIKDLGDWFERTVLQWIKDHIPDSLDGLLPGFSSGTPNRPKVGGVVAAFASGVRGFAGGWAWVGEQGPELMHVPAGADIYPAGESRQMVAGGPSQVVIPVSVGGRALETLIVDVVTGQTRRTY